MWIEKLFKFKYLALLISLLILICGLTAIFVGTLRIYEGILILAGFHEGKPGVLLIESVDAFLFSLVVLILSGGIFKLFCGNESTFSGIGIFSQLKTFKDLKILLWESLLLTLTVWCANSFFLDSTESQNEQLILPVSIVLLAIALHLVRGKKGEH
jgi:hypothetical protein